jgi:hypothetical protein
MTRSDHCPVGGEPCQSLCDEPCKWATPRQSSDKEIRTIYERGFTGGNRTAATWAAFRGGFRAAEPSAQSATAAPLSDDALEAMWNADATSAEDCASLYFFKTVARAVERAHGIGVALGEGGKTND